MNLPSGLVFYLDFKYGTNNSPFANGDNMYGNVSTANDKIGVDEEVSGGLYGAGRFGYSVNQYTASAGLTATGSANSASIAYNAELDPINFREVRIPLTTLSGSDSEAIRSFVLYSGSFNAAGNITTRPELTYISASTHVAFVIPATAVSTGSFTPIVAYSVQPADTSRGDFEDGSTKIPGSGAPASSYVVTSSPGGLTATGGSSPIQIGGLTSGTAYTFTVAGQNPGGVGAASAASNSVTPYDGYESISTVIVGSGGSSTVSFTSIPGTYTHLQLRAIARSGTTGESGMITFNSDTGANYSRHYLIGTGTATASGAGTSANNIDILYINSSSSTANVFATNVLDILDYANTNKYKTVKLLAGADQNGSGAIGLYSGSWRSTSAITSITITPSSSIAQYSTFELFGIRG